MTSDIPKKEHDRVDQLITAIDRAYHRPRLLMWRGFIMGLFSGLGATIGVALVVAILGVLIRQFGGIPFIGEWLNGLGTILPGR